MIIKTRKYAKECSSCNKEVASAYLVQDFSCNNCGNKVDLTRSVFIKEVEVEITKENVVYNYSIILDRLEVYLDLDIYNKQRHVFTIMNPELKNGFPSRNFPSQYNNKETKNEIKTWILNNYFDLFKKII
jgi:predicted RNA-binding Zn-ribbon protein involved in translation (DUF1610 family)